MRLTHARPCLRSGPIVRSNRSTRGITSLCQCSANTAYWHRPWSALHRAVYLGWTKVSHGQPSCGSCQKNDQGLVRCIDGRTFCMATWYWLGHRPKQPCIRAQVDMAMVLGCRFQTLSNRVMGMGLGPRPGLIDFDFNIISLVRSGVRTLYSIVHCPFSYYHTNLASPLLNMIPLWYSLCAVRPLGYLQFWLALDFTRVLWEQRHNRSQC